MTILLNDNSSSTLQGFEFRKQIVQYKNRLFYVTKLIKVCDFSFIVCILITRCLLTHIKNELVSYFVLDFKVITLRKTKLKCNYF